MAKPKTPWLHSRPMLLTKAVLALFLVYVFGSLAIDSGRWLHYFLTFIAFVLGVKFLTHFIKTYGKK
ncbi:hypothetical protein H0X10_00865 [Candidatus Saccharibacteria bacterium]|nr:hypothetical protein [Candidatus Saccharibacteria bacterium]